VESVMSPDGDNETDATLLFLEREQVSVAYFR
jgi:hypothetical protein